MIQMKCGMRKWKEVVISQSLVEGQVTQQVKVEGNSHHSNLGGRASDPKESWIFWWVHVYLWETVRSWAICTFEEQVDYQIHIPGWGIINNEE